MASLSEYKEALDRARANGDSEAVAYFQGKVAADVTAQQPQGGNILQPLISGATFNFADELAGVGGGIASALSGQGFGQGYSDTTKAWRESEDAFRQRNPWTSFGADVAGAAAFPLAAAKVLGSGAKAATTADTINKGYKTAAIGGAAYGAGGAEGGIGERLEGAAYGAGAGFLGNAMLRGAGKVGRAILPKAGPRATEGTFKRDMNVLKSEGIPVSPAEKLASPQLRMAERIVGGYRGSEGATEGRTQKVYSKLMDYAGFNKSDVATGELSTESVSRANKILSDKYDTIFNGVHVKVADIDPKLSALRNEIKMNLPHEQSSAAMRIVDSLHKELSNNTIITGKHYKRLRSQASAQARLAERSSNPYNAHVYRKIRDALDDSFKGAAPRSTQEVLKKLDRQYAGYAILRDAVRGRPGENPSVPSLISIMKNGRKHPDTRFRRLLDAYNNTLIKGYPQSSGTAENIAATRVLPPLMSMNRARGARWAASAPVTAVRNAAALLPLPEGTRGLVTGQQFANSPVQDWLEEI